MKEFFIKSILNFLFNVKAEQWEYAIKLVRNLALDDKLTNTQRANKFLGYFIAFNDTFKPWVAETIRNIAVGFARKKGWIPK